MKKGGFLFPFLALGGALFVMIILLMLVAVVGSERQQRAAEEAVDLSQARLADSVKGKLFVCHVRCHCKCARKGGGSDFQFTVDDEFSSCATSKAELQNDATDICNGTCLIPERPECAQGSIPTFVKHTKLTCATKGVDCTIN